MRGLVFMEKKRTLKIYKEGDEFVIERINEFNHSHKSYWFEEGLKEQLTHYMNHGILDTHEIVANDNEVWSLVINHLSQNQTSKKSVGRPKKGVTKKVSLTMPEEHWEWFDEKAEGNRSEFLRRIVWNALGNESEWSNNACLGYAILGAKNLGYDDEQIRQLVGAIYREFDFKTVDEAKNIYNQSDY